MQTVSRQIKPQWPIALLFFALLAVSQAASLAQTSAQVTDQLPVQLPDQLTDQFTPVIASALTPSTQAVLGADDKYHAVYELEISNTRPTPVTIQQVLVLDPGHLSAALATYRGEGLISRLRTLGSSAVESPVLQFNQTLLLLIDLTFDSPEQTPAQLVHRFDVLAASTPSPKAERPVPLSYTIAPIRLSPHVLEIGAPLSGKGWIAVNGCCAITGVHRSTGLPVNGRIYFAQRFAIDWMRLDSSGRMVHGDVANVHSYPSYGASVLAVADATVVSTLNTLNDQPPGTLPDPSTINLSNVDGNYIILDLGNSVYALYAHLEKGSISVQPGQRVKRGQVIARLGNSGNTSAPHLHFHLMDGPSAIGSSGLPYVIDTFDLAGQIPPDKFAAATGVEGDWSQGISAHPVPRHHQFPLDLTIIDFPPGTEP